MQLALLQAEGLSPVQKDFPGLVGRSLPFRRLQLFRPILSPPRFGIYVDWFIEMRLPCARGKVS
jgi:hypothetical protein